MSMRYTKLRAALIAVATAITITAWVTTATAATGLRGAYYLPGGYELDDDGLPIAKKEPDAIRIDPQIAFGRGKGFVLAPHGVDAPDRYGPYLIWWPKRSSHAAVIWKGYVHLPKAGTYYFTTVSATGAAVYLNQSRVALNAGSGGHIPSEAFAYPDPDRAFPPNKRAYVVPVPVTGPRILPIEIRYVAGGGSSVYGSGIDLYWVTPDSKRDQAGKPIAELVPAQALSVEPPGAIQPSAVSRAHSTISSDLLYMLPEQDNFATLTIRLADRQGRPVAGKRVHVSHFVPGWGQPDLVVQPEQPTNAEGITTAKVYKRGTDAFYFATDVDDLVDVGQVAEIVALQRPSGTSFLPFGFAPYYDGQSFRVSPKPLRVGQPTTFLVPLTNRQKVPARISVRVLSNQANIGLLKWNRVGESETFVMQPGESKEVSITWTPTKEADYVCFKVEVWGTLQQRAELDRGWPFVRSAHAATGDAKKDTPNLLDSRWQNIGPIQCDIPKATPKPAPTPQQRSDRKPPRCIFVAPLEGVMIREGPSPTARAVSQPSRGARLCTMEYVVDRSGKPEWYYVRPPGQTPGWLSADHTMSRKPAEHPQPRIDDVRKIPNVGETGSMLCGAARG